MLILSFYFTIFQKIATFFYINTSAALEIMEMFFGIAFQLEFEIKKTIASCSNPQLLSVRTRLSFA